MGRRTFFGALAGALSCLLPRGRAAVTESGYWYDWSIHDGPQSNDPRFRTRSLPFGGDEVHRVYVDDRLMTVETRIFRVETGPRGKAVGYVYRDGHPVLIPGTGKLLTMIYPGHVRYEYPVKV